MKAALIGIIGIFWAMQIVANLAFKYGTGTPARWWPCFVVGNVIGVSSIFFMMKIYERMNANIALTIAGGGTFLLVQVAMAAVFGSRLTVWQWAGIVAVAVGMAVAGMGGPKTVS